MGWFRSRFERDIDKAVRRAVDDCAPSIIREAVERYLPEVMAGMDGDARPKTRDLFIRQLDAELRANYGHTGDRELREAVHHMRDLEEACAPWGDESYEWNVSAARTWLEDVMEDR